MTKKFLAAVIAVTTVLGCLRMPVIAANMPPAYEVIDGVERPLSSILTYKSYKYYVQDDGTIALCSFTGYEGSYWEGLDYVAVPEQIDGRTVTRLGIGLFSPPYVPYGELMGALHRLSSPIGEISIPDTITSIGNGAFSCCYRLYKIELPKGIREIPASAFANTYSLKNIKIPDSVEVIGSGAFAGSGIERLNLGKNIKTVDESAFSHCYRLREVTIEGKAQVGYNAFNDCPDLKTYRIGKNVKLNQLSFASDYDGLPFWNVRVYGYKGSSIARLVKNENANRPAWTKIKFIPLTAMKKAKVKGVTAKKYNKAVKKSGARQKIKVYVKKKLLKKGRDYTVSYQNNQKRGKAKIIITGINKYDGVIKRSFKIR